MPVRTVVQVECSDAQEVLSAVLPCVIRAQETVALLGMLLLLLVVVVVILKPREVLIPKFYSLSSF